MFGVLLIVLTVLSMRVYGAAVCRHKKIASIYRQIYAVGDVRNFALISRLFMASFPEW